MASKVRASTATSLFLSFNFLFFALVSCNYDDYSPKENQIVNVNDLPKSSYPLSQEQGRSCNPLNLRVCAGLLGLVEVDVEVGDKQTEKCCGLIKELVDVEAAVCLCTAINANVFGIIDVDASINLSLLLNSCGCTPAAQYHCTPHY
ncbi:hypothetical protein PTKIN_Ptkin16aG0050100 [Pterospermum kingtungense]